MATAPNIRLITYGHLEINWYTKESENGIINVYFPKTKIYTNGGLIYEQEEGCCRIRS